MNRSYAMTWQEPNGAPHAGKLEVDATGVRLEGRNRAGPLSVLVPYSELLSLSVAPGPERLGGRPTLVVARSGGSHIRLASIGAAGIISEVAEQVASMKAGNVLSSDRVAIVVPLREGKRDEAERLLDQGPPFDPEGMGLESHEVFLTEDEAIFVFDAAAGFDLQKLLGDSKVWASAAAWHDVIAGPPRIAKTFYAWASVDGPSDLSFEPTPGPGDSEGGDIYSP